MSRIYTLIKIVIVTYILGSIFYFLFEIGLKKYNIHRSEKLDEILIHKTNYKEIFIGSSKVYHGVNPHIVDSISGSKSFNIGMDGANIFELNTLFKAYLENHPSPKTVFLNLDVFSFVKNDYFFNHTFYYPYMKNNVIRQSLIEIKKWHWIQNYIPFTLFSEYDDYSKSNAVKGIFSKGSDIPTGQFQHLGYISNSLNNLTPTSTKTPDITYDFDANGIIKLNEIIQICEEKKIHLILTFAPKYKSVNVNTNSEANKNIDSISSIALYHNLEFWRADQLSLCSDSSMFLDMGHLNTKGAFEFSKIVGTKVKSLSNIKNNF
jgi:hypothetical protein